MKTIRSTRTWIAIGILMLCAEGASRGQGPAPPTLPDVGQGVGQGTLQGTGQGAGQGAGQGNLPGTGQGNGRSSGTNRSPTPAMGSDDLPELSTRLSDHGMENLRNGERQKKLVEDTDKLVALVNQLKEDVDKSTKDTLSLDVVRKADEIEKLAHSVKEKMKGS